MAKDIKIFVSHRIDLDSETIDNPLFVPVRCGAVYDKRENITMLGDDTGDNISNKRNFLGEFTVQYWAWKNIDADYYGLCHYRRYLSFSDQIYETKYAVDKFNGTVYHNEIIEEYLDEESVKKYNLLNAEHMREVIERYDVITSEWCDITKMYHAKGFCNSVKEYWLKTEGILLPHNTINILEKIIMEDYPEMSSILNEYFGGKRHLGYNCFLMKKAIFEEYNQFLFDILFKIEKEIKDIEYFDELMSRVCAYVGEILYGMYIYFLEKKSLNIKHLQLVFFKDTKKILSIQKIYNSHGNIPIVMVSSNYYVPYLACCIKSIINNVNNKNTYDIIVLHKEITDQNQKKLLELSKEYENITISFYNPQKEIKNIKFYSPASTYVEEQYYKFLTPWVLHEYNKAIILDSDIIVNRDISYLYNNDIDKFFIGAVKDVVWQGLMNNTKSDFKKYSLEEMKLDNPYNYINMGVIVMNLELFRKHYKLDDLITKVQSKKCRLLEQDVLNILFENKIKFLDLKYNFCTETGAWVTEQLSFAPLKSKLRYYTVKKSDEDIFIFHYANQPKPWNNPEIEFADKFWSVARETPFYETMLYRLSAEQANGTVYWHQQFFHTKFLNQNQKQKIKDFIKIFFPAGTKRHYILKKAYFKLRGWPINF